MSAGKPEKPEGGSKKKGGKLRLLLIVAAVLGLAGAGGWFSGVIPRLLGKGEPAAAEAHAGGHETGAGEKAAEKVGEKRAEKGGAHAEGGHAEKGKVAGKEAGPGDPSFLDLPDIVANLNTGSRRAAYVKLRAKLELSKPEDQPVLQAALPRVLDLFQGYLREMRPEELRGTAGTYRLREELLARTNLAAPPARVVAVLFTEMIVQ